MSRELEPPFGARDPGGMTARIVGIPEQIDDALARMAASPWPTPGGSPDVLAVGAMGGSAMSAEMTAALYEDRLPRPMVTVRDYTWPAFVTKRSLALLSSYSGNTEETLSLYREAKARGVPRVALSTGGELAASCRSDGVFVAGLPAGSPPRAAMFASWVALTHLVHALGWVDDPAPSWQRAAARLRQRNAVLGPERPEADNPAKQMARAVAGRMLLVYAGSRFTGPLASRIRHQMNENAKVFGHSALAPELNHNEIVGWERPGSVLRNASVLFVHDADDSPEVTARLELTADYVRQQGAEVHDIRAGEGDRLCRIAELVQFGDYLSLYLAFLNGADPTPIASIDAFKARLAERGTPRST